MTDPLKNLPRDLPLDNRVTVLYVSSCERDRLCIRQIFSHTNWVILEADDCQAARETLRRNRVGVILCDCRLPDGEWKEVLLSLSQQPDSPLLIVSSDGADVSLWAELLNLGAYDFLSKPFDRVEVTRVISLAWLHWRNSVAKKPPNRVVIPNGGNPQRVARATA